ncbi:MAG: ABC transporter permease [Bacteroidales bacterium]|nr:ABC transporter permease [Bacteroidales bacterium]
MSLFPKHKKIWQKILLLCFSDVKEYVHRPLVLFCLLVAPLISIFFFTSLMLAGLPTDLPVAVVDEDDTQVTRSFLRTMDAMEQTDIVVHYKTFSDAREAMQKGDIYAFFYIPKGTTQEAISSRQPHVSFYTNEIYFIPASLVMKDMRMAAELLGLSLTRETLYGKGLTLERAMGILQPIVIEKHPLGNPYLNYSVYLSNIILPGIIFILSMLMSSYVIGMEWKKGRQKLLYMEVGCSQTTALAGKLLPITFIYSLFILFIDVYLYKYLEFPCQCGIFPMFVWGVLGVMASQGIAILVFGIFVGQMRFSMSVCSLWGILGISLSGFTFPVTAMHPSLQALCYLFPLRHYYLIYVNQALNGYPIGYVWTSVFAFLCFMLVPFVVMPRYRKAFLKTKYKP